jgi:hypothetical protein
MKLLPFWKSTYQLLVASPATGVDVWNQLLRVLS